MFEQMIADGPDLRIRFRNPRHSAALDILFLLDLHGRIEDVGLPGHPTAHCLYHGGDALLLEADTVVFPDGARLAGGYYLYAPYSGQVHPGTDRLETSRIGDFVARVNLPALARQGGPSCTPDEARALGLPAQSVVAGLYQDILGRVPEPEEESFAADRLRQGELRAAELALELASGQEFQEQVRGKRLAPGLSAFRCSQLWHESDTSFLLPDASMQIRSPELAFRALGLEFDPEIWSEGHYDALLQQAGHDLAAFARNAAPLSQFYAARVG
ncbi:MAG: DUF4214 domain-containing protein [Neomegalonema sp.]|nr:DUF4214 domain-containing protein [Neomegalonema sp.]